VLAELITQSQPGDLFVVKNVGNIVPPANVRGDTNSTAAAIEFAVETLRVSDIVICGHSQCGAILALLGKTPVSDATPHLRDWLNLAAPVLETLKKGYAHLHGANERETAAAEENVLFGLDNLHSYPCVQDRLMDGTLRLHGWFFKIATAELFAYAPETRQFSPLTGEKS
jgi:carbonic anhydrase